MTRALRNAVREWRIAYTSPDISGVIDAVEAGLGVSALTRATLSDNMRVISNSIEFPKLDKIGIGLFYKLPRLSAAGRELANRLFDSIEKSTDQHFMRSATLMGS